MAERSERKRPVATVTIIVHYDTIPNRSELEDEIESLNGTGKVITAELVVHQDTTMDLLN